MSNETWFLIRSSYGVRRIQFLEDAVKSWVQGKASIADMTKSSGTGTDLFEGPDLFRKDSRIAITRHPLVMAKFCDWMLEIAVMQESCEFAFPVLWDDERAREKYATGVPIDTNEDQDGKVDTSVPTNVRAKADAIDRNHQ